MSRRNHVLLTGRKRYGALPNTWKNTYAVRSILKQMHSADQSLWRRWVTARDSRLPISDTTVILKAKTSQQRVHDRLIRAMLREIGWPAIQEYGVLAPRCAFTIIVHSEDIRLQRTVLAAMERALRDNSVDPFHYAYLWDRVALKCRRKQRFGTHFRPLRNGTWAVYPIESLAGANEFRRLHGLKSIATEITMHQRFMRRLHLNGRS
jgi:hypothetical protein